MNEIQLLNNNNNREWSDFEWIEEFYRFLQGDVPAGIYLATGCALKLTPEQAMSIIWYLQEHFPLLPDNFERCEMCDNLYDSNNEGFYSGLGYNQHFCGACECHSETTYCYGCGDEIYKKDCKHEYYCDECVERNLKNKEL